MTGTQLSMANQVPDPSLAFGAPSFGPLYQASNPWPMGNPGPVNGQYHLLTDRRRTSPARRGRVHNFGPAEPPGRISKDPSPVAVRSRWGSAWHPCVERAPGTSGAGPKTDRRTGAVRTARPCVPPNFNCYGIDSAACRAPLSDRFGAPSPAPKQQTERASPYGAT